MNSYPLFFLPETQYIELELESKRHQGAHEVGGHAQGRGRPHPLGQGVGPLVLIFCQYFLLFPKIRSVEFQVIQELLFLHINNTMAILLKTASVRVSSIQIMQVRVQNKGKSVWKSRYDGDVSCVSLKTCVQQVRLW